MGATVCQAVADDPDLDLVGGVDPHHAGLELSRVAGRRRASTCTSRATASRFIDAGVDVVVDFTEARRGRENHDVGSPSTASTRWSARRASPTATSTSFRGAVHRSRTA